MFRDLRSLITIIEVTSKILTLAVKNIQVNLIFLARLFVSLQNNAIAHRLRNNENSTYRLWQDG